MFVATQPSVPGVYRPPLFEKPLTSSPPQTIISLPVHTAVCSYRAAGAAVQVSSVQLAPVDSAKLYIAWPDALAALVSLVWELVNVSRTPCHHAAKLRLGQETVTTRTLDKERSLIKRV